ncbi:MAG: putative ATPase [Methanohalophilus sp. T328-1]|jgi:hypothetical protein|nr:MAG: putative ATPase [Methanohalophilus sp. T328-1]
MLIEFSAENYRSIKDRVTFSMLATSDNHLESNTIISSALKKNDSLLKSAMIYGANASGKTNVLKAMRELRDLVRNSAKNQIGDNLPYRPFKLSEQSRLLPTRFIISFIQNNIRYKYEVSFSKNKILEEYLHYYPNNRKAIIFERNDGKIKVTTDKKKQKDIYSRTLPNVLYLSSSAQQNYSKTSEPFKWFNDFDVVTSKESFDISNTIDLLNKNNEYKNNIIKFLKEADLSIANVEAKIEDVDISEISDLPPKLLERFNKMIGDGDQVQKLTFNSFHTVGENAEKSPVAFTLDEESDGTQRLFSLIGPWLNTLKEGRVLIMDELDVRLHPFITEFLINLFHDPTQNVNNAQLVFTTHNTYTLSQKLFRRDQIWFTEKDPIYGNTDLYSLSEFKPRKDKNIQKGYLMGRYGAIPFIPTGRIF